MACCVEFVVEFQDALTHSYWAGVERGERVVAESGKAVHGVWSPHGRQRGE